MRLLLLLLCFFCLPMFANDKSNECFTKEEEDILAREFQMFAYQSDYLFRMIDHTVDKKELYELFNQHKELIYLSTKRWYDLRG